MAKKPTFIPPEGGVTVRMYRIGHGDCFLLAFPSETGERPVYVLIDCGYKRGSPGFIDPPTIPKAIAKSIMEATGDYIDVAVITHEHEDHVSAITKSHFKDLKIGQAWFAWTESPTDPVAIQLREKYKDSLLQLVAIRNSLAAKAGDVEAFDRFLKYELGMENTGDESADWGSALAAAAKDPSKSANKKSMKLIKDQAELVVFLNPHESAIPLPRAKDVRVFPLGPSRNRDMLDTDPEGEEEFHLGANGSLLDFFAAGAGSEAATPPFAARYRLRQDEAMTDLKYGAFFTDYYGAGVDPASADMTDVPSNAAWRRIDNLWHRSALELMIKKNNATNNTSLVLAFELGKNGKVLLFAADAQRSNWLSWGDGDWSDGDRRVTARDLIGRTVLYKVGHHGSHNATLDGDETSGYPSLGWMGLGKHGREFTAMITAVRAWADTQNGWDHPMPKIKTALLKKCAGRVLQTDTPVTKMSPPIAGTDSDWKAFTERLTGTNDYFDYHIKFEVANA